MKSFESFSSPDEENQENEDSAEYVPRTSDLELSTGGAEAPEFNPEKIDTEKLRKVIEEALDSEEDE